MLNRQKGLSFAMVRHSLLKETRSRGGDLGEGNEGMNAKQLFIVPSHDIRGSSGGVLKFNISARPWLNTWLTNSSQVCLLDRYLPTYLGR